MLVRMILDIKRRSAISIVKNSNVYSLYFFAFLLASGIFGRLWEGRILVHFCTIRITEWQQAAENRHDYFPGV